MAVPPLIDEADFREVQRLLHSRNPKVTPPRVVSGPTLLTGIAVCAACGGGMILRTGNSSSGRSYHYYTCSTKARQGPVGCRGVAVRMDRLDAVVFDFLLSDLLASDRLELLMAPLLTHRDAWTERRRAHVADLRQRSADAGLKLRRLYEAVENGILTDTDRMFGERVAELNALRDQADADATRIAAIVDQATPPLAAGNLRVIAVTARSRLRNGAIAMRRPHVRALVQRIEVVSKEEMRVRGSRNALLKALITASGGRMAAVPGRLALAWRNTPDADDSYAMTLPL